MKIISAVIIALALTCIFPINASAKKKKVAPRGMLESMQSIPCGAKHRGLAGIGSLYGSVGITHVNSDEKLCPQYLVRTDDMDYEIRPKNTKHAAILPVGQEVELKIKKDHVDVKVADGGKAMTYIVVAMRPAGQDDSAQSSS
jgi:hypothetical protein